MKILGLDVQLPTNEIIPIIRGGQEIIFQASCVISFDEFDAVCKEPVPRTEFKPGSAQGTPKLNAPEYLKEVDEYNQKRIDWLCCKSLLATEGLTWEKVDFSNPDTFALFKKELQEAGFNDYHIGQLVRGVSIANGINTDRIEEARKRFLVTGQVQSE